MILADFIFLALCIVGSLILATQRTFLWVWAFFFGSLGILWQVTAGTTTHSIVATLFFVLMAGSLLFSFAPIRQRLFSAPIFRRARHYKAHISNLEKQALAAGSAGFETGFFEGKPRWDQLRSYEIKPFTPNEQKFLNGPIKKFCELTHDWKIRQSRVIPDSLWEYAKQEGFSGLRVHKEWGGKQYSFQAQSIMLSKVATRAVDSAIFIELPTSLYPDEIINEYGTDEQKKYYLPRLAKGEEVVSFAVTGAQGSDVGGMTDEGVVTYGEHEGQQTLGVRINCNKRYITFAPKASLFVLAFSLKDPEGHLGLGANLALPSPVDTSNS
ncbi:MAG: acyl-CoA dehydrogenase family protein [Candidatus Paceibacterota bacterium]